MSEKDLDAQFDHAFACLIEEEDTKQMMALLQQFCINCDQVCEQERQLKDFLLETKYDDVEVCFKHEAGSDNIEIMVYQDKVMLEEYHIAQAQLCNSESAAILCDICHLIRRVLNELPLHKNKPCLPD